MKKSKRIIIIAILACLLLLVSLLYASVSRDRKEKENIQKTEERDMQKGQASLEKTEQRENDILKDAPEEITENVERKLPVLTENPNPYFFPDDVLTVTYHSNTENGPEEKIPEQIKMSVCREKAFPEGILYSLKAEDGESASEDDAGSQEKEVFELGYFYVQADKIYLIRDLRNRREITEENLIEAGTVVCQSESKAEDVYTRNTLGPHEIIKAAEGKCAFYGQYDTTGETDGFYEYFMWQEGKGLTGYRFGHGEVENISLCTDGIEKAGFEDENTFNPYFFPEDKTIIKYEGEFDVAGVYFKEKDVKFGRTDVEVSVEKEKILENGILYSIKILDEDKFYYDDGEAGQYGKKRLDLGYFYVQAEKIYLIRDVEIDSDITEKELIKYGKVVCQPEPKEDILDPEEKGRHESIGIIGDQCISGWYQNYIETDWWESFIWQKGLGLVEYKSGRGALAELVYITIIP